MIYFLRLGNAVKIGYTQRLPRRMKTLSTATPNDPVVLGVMAGDRDRERELHRRFRHRHIKREWFTLEMDIVAFVEMHCRPYLVGINHVDPVDPPEPPPALGLWASGYVGIMGVATTACGWLEPDWVLLACGLTFLGLSAAFAVMYTWDRRKYLGAA